MTKGQMEGEIGQWTPVGGRKGGTVTALALSPDFAGDGVVFAATGAGPFRSQDSGRSWSPCSHGMSTPFIEAIAVSANFARDRTIFLGARDGTVSRSTDGGESWTGLGWLGEPSPVVALAMSPHYADDGTLIAGTFEDGVFRSTDRGATWAPASFGLLDLSVLALVMSPDYAHDETAFVATASGVYRSRNGGRSWREVDLGGDEVAVQALAISPKFAADRTIFAGAEENGVYRSTDGGTTFQPLGGATNDICINALAISRHFSEDRTLAAATSAGIHISRDSGRTWQVANADADAALCLAMDAAPSGELVLLAGLQGAGIIRSGDSGRTWHIANQGLVAGSILGMTLSPDFPRDATLFCWGFEEGVLRSNDGGRTWQSTEIGIESIQIASLTLSPSFAADGILFAATSIGIYRSGDRGNNWSVIGLINLPSRAVALSPAFARDAALAAITADELHTSDDGGYNWQHAEAPFEGDEVLSIQFSPDYLSDQALYVTTRQRGDDREPAKAQIWRGIREGPASLWPTHSGHSTQWECLFSEKVGDGPISLALPPGLRHDGAFFVGADSRVYRPLQGSRENTGQGGRPIWVSKAIGTNGLAVLAIVASPDFARDHTIFAATSDGVYRSRDSGVSWESISAGLTRQSVLDVMPSPHYVEDRAMYALTLGGQIWRYEEA